MKVCQSEFFTITAASQGWNVEYRSINDNKANITTIFNYSTRQEAESVAQKLALSQDKTFVPFNSSVIAAGRLSNCFLPLELTADWQIIGAGGTYRDLNNVIIAIQAIAKDRSLPCISYQQTIPAHNNVKDVSSAQAKNLPQILLWSCVVSHSNDYCRQLNLAENDLQTIEENLQQHAGVMPTLYDHALCNFLSLDVEGHHFALYIQKTCGTDYGDSWKHLLQIVCVDNPSLNSSTGRGTALINTIPEEWHQKLLTRLDKSIQLSLNKKITAAMQKNASLWNSVSRHSQEYCEKLGLNSTQEFEVIKDFLQDHAGIFPSLKDHAQSSFLSFEIAEHKFALYVQYTIADPYGSDSQYLLKAICVDDPALNNSTGRGTTLINAIPEEWHQKLLARLDKSIQLSLNKKIKGAMQINASLWNSVSRHSQEYCEKLNLNSKRDFEIIEDFLQDHAGIFPSLKDHAQSSFLSFEIAEHKFALYVQDTCACPYGGGWQHLLKAVCLDDPTLNNSTGRGTTLINAIPEEWHQKLLARLDQATKLSLRKNIEEASSRNQTLWREVNSNSQEYLAALKGKKKCLLEVEGHQFQIKIDKVCGAPYGGNWKKMAMVWCLNHPALNSFTGQGTTKIHVIPREWHKKLLIVLTTPEHKVPPTVDEVD